MTGLTKKLLDELMEHIDGSQAEDLMSLVEKSKKPAMEMAEIGKPKGVSIEKIDIMKPKKDFDDEANEAIAQAGKDENAEGEPEMSMGEPKMPGEEDEMTDEELAALLKEYL